MSHGMNGRDHETIEKVLQSLQNSGPLAGWSRRPSGGWSVSNAIPTVWDSILDTELLARILKADPATFPMMLATGKLDDALLTGYRGTLVPGWAMNMLCFEYMRMALAGEVPPAEAGSTGETAPDET